MANSYGRYDDPYSTRPQQGPPGASWGPRPLLYDQGNPSSYSVDHHGDHHDDPLEKDYGVPAEEDDEVRPLKDEQYFPGGFRGCARAAPTAPVAEICRQYPPGPSQYGGSSGLTRRETSAEVRLS